MVGKLGTKAAEAAIDKGTSLLVERLISAGEKIWQLNEKRLQDQVRNIVRTQFKRLSFVKTLLQPDLSRKFEHVYVAPQIRSGDLLLRAAYLEVVQHNTLFLVQATAGAGKSSLMRHLYLGALAAQTHLPVFIELRNFNDYDGDFTAFVVEQIIGEQSPFAADILRTLGKLRLALFLDGYDEMSNDGSAKGLAQVRTIAASSNWIMAISTRPTHDFDSWGEFSHWTVERLNQADAVKVIQKSAPDSEYSKKFIDQLISTLYKSYEDFASNPLLLLFMYLTYMRNADIPRKDAVFYEEAYEALYCRHDASKEGYKRKFASGMSIDEFRTVLSWFSLFTIVDGVWSFSASKFKDILKQVLVVCKNDSDVEDVKRDLLHSLCLFAEDGLQIVYVHRSFQEFFGALCLARNAEREFRSEVIPVLLNSVYPSQLFRFLEQLYRIMYLEEVVLTFLKRLTEKFPQLLSDDFEDRLKVIGSEIPVQLHLLTSKEGDFFIYVGFQQELAALYRILPIQPFLAQESMNALGKSLVAKIGKEYDQKKTVYVVDWRELSDESELMERLARALPPIMQLTSIQSEISSVEKELSSTRETIASMFAKAQGMQQLSN